MESGICSWFIIPNSLFILSVFLFRLRYQAMAGGKNSTMRPNRRAFSGTIFPKRYYRRINDGHNFDLSYRRRSLCRSDVKDTNFTVSRGVRISHYSGSRIHGRYRYHKIHHTADQINGPLIRWGTKSSLSIGARRIMVLPWTASELSSIQKTMMVFPETEMEGL